MNCIGLRRSIGAAAAILGALLALAVPSPSQAESAAAEELALALDRAFPKGSIQRENAQAVLRRASEAHEAVARRYEAERRACSGEILVNRCMEQARSRHNEGERLVHRVELEAHEVQRLQAAGERAKRASQEQAQESARDARHGDKDRGARAGAPPHRTDSPAPSPHTTLRAPPPDSAARERRRQAESAQRAAKAVEEAASRKSEAAKYAAQQSREAEENRRHRAERAAARAGAGASGAATRDTPASPPPSAPPSASPRGPVP
jgi:phage tail tape-measure protein